MILKEVQLQETGERFMMFVMIYSGLASVFSGFHWEFLRLAKQLQELTRDAEARAIAKIIMCPQLHKKITFYETK